MAEIEPRGRRQRAANPGRGGRGPGGSGGGRAQRTPVVVHSLSSDGMFHANFVSNGDEPDSGHTLSAGRTPTRKG